MTCKRLQTGFSKNDRTDRKGSEMMICADTAARFTCSCRFVSLRGSRCGRGRGRQRQGDGSLYGPFRRSTDTGRCRTTGVRAGHAQCRIAPARVRINVGIERILLRDDRSPRGGDDRYRKYSQQDQQESDAPTIWCHDVSSSRL